jgi:DNA-binding beta-propeller fold protein YncE
MMLRVQHAIHRSQVEKPVPSGRMPITTASWTRALRILAAVICVGLVFLGSSARPALASAPHVFSFSLTGSGRNALSSPTDVAVDNSPDSSAGDIYVMDTGNFRIEKFSPGGSFLLMFGKEVNEAKVEEGRPESEQNVCIAGEVCQPGKPGESPGAFMQPLAVAVDASSGPSAGDVYASDYATGLISKFDPSGHLITSWGENGQISVGFATHGLVIDATGRLFVLDNAGPSSISKYNQDGSYESSLSTPGYTGKDIAVDASGSLYMLTQEGAVEKFDASGTYLGGIETSKGAVALAINPSDAALFVHQTTPNGISEFAASCPLSNCTPLTSFGEGYLRGLPYQVQGISINASDQSLYVVNPYGAQTSQGDVAVFRRAGVVPDVNTGGAQIGQPDTLFGHVDTAGAGTVTACHFRYLSYEQLQAGSYNDAKSIPCAPSRPISAATEVHADLPSLKPATTYSYYLVAANAQGPAAGVVRQFNTLYPPGVVTGRAVTLDSQSIELSGQVEPAYLAPVTSCRFEYVPEADFPINGYAGAKSAPCSPALPYANPTFVSAHISGLRSSTTYYFRLVAANPERSTTGDNQTGSTSPSVADSVKNSKAHRRPRHHRAVRCIKKACVRLLHGTARLQSWVSPKFPREYGWRFSIYKSGRSLRTINAESGCSGTFTGRGVIATLNGCHGQLRLTYLGSGPFSIRWRVFERCECVKSGRR